MNHPTNDELLLLAYGELPPARGAAIEAHVAACDACRDTFASLERARGALDVAIPERRSPRLVWAALTLAAAVLAAIVISKSAPTRDAVERWKPTTTWSATAGYVTGGKEMMDIDAQLTRLEQGRYYGLSN